MFDTIEAASADERVREALGISIAKRPRARWIGLRLDTQSDGTRRVIGVCHTHQAPRGCPGHALALRNLVDAAVCCGGCGPAVASDEGAKRGKAVGRDLRKGRHVVGTGGEVTGWLCIACKLRPS